MAERHPDLVLAHFRARLEELPLGLRLGISRSLQGAVPPLARHRSAELLRVVRDLLPEEVWLTTLRPSLGLLFKRETEAVFELLTRLRRQWMSGQLPGPIVDRFALLRFEQRVELGSLYADRPIFLGQLLDRLPPSERGALFSSVTARLDTSSILWPTSLLEALPHELRSREVARMLTHREVAGDVEKTLRLLPYLAPELAEEPLRKMLAVPDAEQRAAVMKARLLAGSFYRRGMGEAIAVLDRLRNEQDPVRASVTQTLAEISPTRLPADAMPRLLQLADWVNNARDTSSTTRYFLARLAFRGLEVAPLDGPVFSGSLDLLGRLLQGESSVSLPALEAFSRARREAIVERLLPVIDERTARGDWNLLSSLARVLGRRLGQHARVQFRLETATRKAPDVRVREFIELWLLDPRERDSRVVTVLKRDASAIGIATVSEHLDRRRQDLLDPYLKGKAVKGKFLWSDAVYVPSFRHFALWLPRQQQAMASLLLRLARDQGQHLGNRMRAVARLAELPAQSRPPVDEFLASQELAMRESALPSLSEEPRRLLPFLDRDEARVAAYMLPAALRLKTPAEAAAILDEALKMPMKMTARKEMMRLLAVPRLPDSLALLLGEWKRQDLSRDVRIAVLHAAGQMLDRDEAWPLVEQAARSAEPWITRQTLAVAAAELEPSRRPRYLELIRGLTRSPERLISQAAWAALPGWLTVDRQALARVAQEGLVDLGNLDWRAALQLWLSAIRDGGLDLEVGLAVAKLLALGTEPEATTERDRPARQRLAALVDGLAGLPRVYRENLGMALRQSAAALPDPQDRFRLLVAAGEPLGTMADSISSYEEMGALERAVALDPDRQEHSGESLRETARSLASGERKEARRLAVRVLSLAAAKLSWNQECRELLLRLRNDAEADVALPAQRLYTTTEA
jgi:hypothetical protein